MKSLHPFPFVLPLVIPFILPIGLSANCNPLSKLADELRGNATVQEIVAKTHADHFNSLSEAKEARGKYVRIEVLNEEKREIELLTPNSPVALTSRLVYLKAFEHLSFAAKKFEEVGFDFEDKPVKAYLRLSRNSPKPKVRAEGIDLPEQINISVHPEGLYTIPMPTRSERNPIPIPEIKLGNMMEDPTVLTHELFHIIQFRLAQKGGVKIREFSPLEAKAFSSLSEGFADYFSYAFTSIPVMGAYSLHLNAPEKARDIRESPTSGSYEIHNQGHKLAHSFFLLESELKRQGMSEFEIRRLIFKASAIFKDPHPTFSKMIQLLKKEIPGSYTINFEELFADILKFEDYLKKKYADNGGNRLALEDLLLRRACRSLSPSESGIVNDVFFGPNIAQNRSGSKIDVVFSHLTRTNAMLRT